MHAVMKNALAIAGLAVAAQVAAQVTLYEREGFDGRSFTTERSIRNLERFGFNDRASSVVVRGPRWQRWEVCEDRAFEGRCVVLRRGDYPSLASMGLNNAVSSVRVVERSARYSDDRYAPPPPVAAYDYRRRDHERLYRADIVAVRAVVGTPERRCWVERDQVVQRSGGEPNVGGAIVGGVIGGILGHQIGSGSGRDAATALGVVGGAAIGSQSGRDRDGRQVVTQDVQRCTSAPRDARPDYWDVTYQFRGQEHRVQMASPPGAYITVNENGEPRAS